MLVKNQAQEFDLFNYCNCVCDCVCLRVCGVDWQLQVEAQKNIDVEKKHYKAHALETEKQLKQKLKQKSMSLLLAILCGTDNSQYSPRDYCWEEHPRNDLFCVLD